MGKGAIGKGIGSALSGGGGKKGGGGSSGGGIGPEAMFAAQQASTRMGNFYADAGLGTSSMATAARSFPFIAAGAASDTADQAGLGDALTQLAGLQGQQNPGGGTNTPGGTGQPTSDAGSPDSGAGTPV